MGLFIDTIEANLERIGQLEQARQDSAYAISLIREKAGRVNWRAYTRPTTTRAELGQLVSSIADEVDKDLRSVGLKGWREYVTISDLYQETRAVAKAQLQVRRGTSSTYVSVGA